MQRLTRSLLFTDLDTEYSSGADAPLDLKLDMLLPEGTAELFRVKPTEKGLLLRREFFSNILADRENSVDRFEKALSLLSDAEEAKEALDGAVCDNAKHYIFSEYAARMAAIYRAFSEKTELGELYGGFRSYFADAVSSPEFDAMSRKLAEISAAKERVGALDLNAEGEKIKVFRESPRSMREKLSVCLDAYGISVPESGRRLF